MNPYPLLEWIKSNGGAVTGDSDARFCEAPRTGPPVPSAHDGGWPTPANPGLSPDLDADSGDPKPNRAAQNDESDKGTPARKPSIPDRSEKTRNDTPPKHPGDDRPQAPKHARPDEDQEGQTRPDTDEDLPSPPKPDPSEKDPPKKGSPEGDPPEEDPPKPTLPASQYDPSTGKPAYPAENLPHEPTEDRKRTRRPPLTREQAASEVLHPKGADPLPPAGTSFESVRRIARARGALQSPCQTKNADRCDPIPAVY